MDTTQSFSLFQFLAGAVLIFATILVSVQTRKYVPEELHTDWRKTTILILFLFSCYVLFVLARLGNLEYPLEPITASMFLGSACFVYFVVLLIRSFISKIHEKDERLRSFEKAVETMQLGVTITDVNGKILYTNPAEAAMHGFVKEDLVGRDARMFAPQNLWNPMTPEQMEKVESNRRESVNIRKDGSTLPVQLMSDVVKDPDGTPIALITTCEDITERRKAEDAFEHRIAVEKAVAQLSGLLVTEKKADFTEALSILGRAVGVERASIFLFRPDGRVADNAYEWCAVGVRPLKEYLQGLDGDIFPWWMERLLKNENIVIPDSSELPEEARSERQVLSAIGVKSVLAVPMHSAGRLLGYLAFDNTQNLRAWSEEDLGLLRASSEILGAYFLHKKAEEEMIRAAKLESLGVLAGGIAHDFNNILTAIIGNITIALNHSRDERLARVLTASEGAAWKAAGLARQLLTFSKGGAPVKKAVSIAELIKESASFAQVGSSVRCRFFIPENIYPVEIDEGQMSQVIHNLVLNAKESMPEGGTIEIRAENVEPEAGRIYPLKPGKYIKISVKDHGTGIPRENLSKIFDPYFTTKDNGNGLGLASVYSIVKKHEGHVSVESAPGEGSAFHLYLPASDKAQPPAEVQGVRRAASKAKILVMDDDVMVRDLLKAMLAELGHEASFAADPDEAVGLYKDAMESGGRFDAVIIDLVVPGGSGGKEAIKRLAEIDPQVKAVVSSGYSNDPITAEYKKHGFSGVMTKPYGMDKLNEVLLAVLSEDSGP